MIFFGIWYGDVSIRINTIFRGMNIHLPAILGFTRGTRVLTHCHISSWGIWYLRTRSVVRGSQPTPVSCATFARPWDRQETHPCRALVKNTVLRLEIPWYPMNSHGPWYPILSHYIIYNYIYIDVYIYILYHIYHIYHIYIYIHIYIYVSHYYIPHVIPSFEDPLVRRLTVECIQLMGAERMGNMLRKS